ncbi:MAG: nucleotide disphospho-sugar-binding domain-containing protein [Cyanobacteria bacterium J06598_3]
MPPINVPWKYAPTWWARLRNQAGYKLIDRLAKPIVDIQADYRQQWNLPVLESANLAFSPLAQLSQQPPEFEYPRESLPDCFHFTGPYSNEASREPAAFPFEKLTGQPLIYTSLGTIQNRVLDTFKTIAQACEGLDAQVVIALGGGSPPEALPPLPGNPIVVGFAPQLALLKKATLTITHAGMNTVLESLSNGVPMVAIPITNDQPGVAARVAWSGTGEVVSLKGLKVTDLRAAITKVLTQESYKQNALKLQTAIQAAGGVKKAADIVETVLKTGKPVLRS